MKKEMTTTQVAQKLGLGDVHAPWLAKLEATGSATDLLVPTPDAFSALLDRLNIAPEDAKDILRTIPSRQRN